MTAANKTRFTTPSPRWESKRHTTPATRVLTLTTIDQGASSISNFALALLVAHYSHARAIGVLALLTVSYVIAQGVVRSLTSDCLLTRSNLDEAHMATLERAGYLSALVVASGISVLILIASAFMHPDFAVPFAIFAVCFPLIALQDFSRFIGISRFNPAYAIYLDTAWVVLFIVAVVPIELAHRASLDWLWAAWTGVGALVGLSTMATHLKVRETRHLLRVWQASERAVGVRFAGNYLLTATWIYFIYYPLLLFISVDSVGLIKLAQLVLGPITVLATGLQSAVVPIVSRRFKEGVRRTLWFCFFAASAIAVTTALWTTVVYLLPVHDVARVFGPTWFSARPVYLAIGLAFVFGSYSGIAVAGLRAIRAASVNLWLGIAMVPLSLVPQIGGAALWGAKGFAGGMAVSFGLYALGAWFMLYQQARSYSSRGRTATV